MDNSTAALYSTPAAMDSNDTSSGNATKEPFNICANTSLIEQTFSYFYFFPLLIIVLLMSFFKVRKRLWPNCCKGRPAVLYPVNFIDEYARRWMYIAVFIMLTYRILFLFNGAFYIPVILPKNVSFLNVFVTLLNVIILCIQYYPLAACIVMRRSIIANAIGLFLVLPWTLIFIFRYGMCPPSEDKSEDHKAILEIIYEIPLFIALGALIIGYSYDLYQNIRAYYRKRKCGSYETKHTKKEELYILYIRTLLKQKRTEARPLTLKEKIKEKFTYVKLTGFKYPPRVICTVALGLYALYKTAVSLTLEAYFALNWISKLLDVLAPEFVTGNNTARTLYLIRVYTDSAKWGFTVCAIVSFIIHIFLMLHFIMQYRTHIRKFFGGDHSWHHQFENSPANILVSGMRYSGYQIAFLIYGYIIMTLVLFLIVVIVVGFIILPLATRTRNAIANFLINKIETLWPAIVIGLAISFMQTLLARFAFLQERGAYMALNNRRLYHVASFFLFFFNVILGLFSCLKRILFSMIIGTVMISRLDRCLLMRGFESHDAGFNAYLSMLTVDVYHNHPILKGFVHILKEEAESRQAPKTILTHNKEGEVETAVELSNRAKIRVRNKYWKLVTLMHNPSLVLERIRSNIAEANKNRQPGEAQLALDSIAGFENVIVNRGSNVDSETAMMSEKV